MEKEPKSLKEARYEMYAAEGKLYSATREWENAKKKYLEEYKKLLMSEDSKSIEGEFVEK